MRADIRRSDSSHSVYWRDDPPQDVREFSQDFLLNAQAADIIHCHLLMSSPNSFKSPFTELSYLPAFFSKHLKLPCFIVMWARRIIWGPQSASAHLLTCSKTPLHSVPSCFSRETSARIFLGSALSRVKYSHIPRRHCSLPTNTFQSLTRCAFFSTTPFQLPSFQWLLALLHQIFIAALLTQIDCAGFSTFFNNH